MNRDVIDRLDGAVVHHGPASDRVYLLKLAGGEPLAIAGRLQRLAAERGYSKIVAKVPAAAGEVFQAAGYRREAAIPRYFRGREDAHFMVKYLDPARRRPEDPGRIAEVLAAARRKGEEPSPTAGDGRETCRVAGPADIETMAALYRLVFATYPFPIHDPEYLARTMAENVIYFGIWGGDRLLALASAEMDGPSGSAEMTDFATLPECRGRGHASRLLVTMEEEMRRRGIRTLYTIARAVSYGMNIAFARQGYRFGGTLTRNTQIAGRLECMNVWYRSLS